MKVWETLTSWLPLPRSEERAARRLLENQIGQLEMDLRRRTEAMELGDRFQLPWERNFDGSRVLSPSGFPRDRSYGRDLPVLDTEITLRQIRAFSRLLCGTNLICIGFQNHVTNFVVGKGYAWEAILRGQKAGPVSAGLKDKDGDGEPDADPDVLACQQVLDDFKRINGWGDSGDTIVEPDNDGSDKAPKGNREYEAYMRAMEDGETFLRLFRGGPDTNGVALARFVEPECVQTPPDETLLSEWGWGIKTDPDDVETRLAYRVVDPESKDPGEEVSASRMLHYKLNTKSSQKRGIPDFFPLQDEATGVRTLIRNMTEVSGILSAIAYIREHAPTTTRDQITGLISAQESSRTDRGASPSTTANSQWGPDRTRSLNLHQAGTIIDVSNQLRYTPGPINSGIPGFIQAEQATLRMIGLRWGCPEYFTGDASNANFASTLVSGGPFERSASARQQSYSQFQAQLAARVLWLAVESGRLRREQVQKVTIRITCPPVVISNKTEDTNRRRTLFDAKVMSPQTWAKQEELDPKVEAANWKAWNEQFPDESQPGLGLGGMGGGGGADGGDLAGLFGESRKKRRRKTLEAIGPPPFPGAQFDKSISRWVNPNKDRPEPPSAPLGKAGGAAADNWHFDAINKLSDSYNSKFDSVLGDLDPESKRGQLMAGLADNAKNKLYSYVEDSFNSLYGDVQNRAEDRISGMESRLSSRIDALESSLSVEDFESEWKEAAKDKLIGKYGSVDDVPAYKSIKADYLAQKANEMQAGYEAAARKEYDEYLSTTEGEKQTYPEWLGDHQSFPEWQEEQLADQLENLANKFLEQHADDAWGEKGKSELAQKQAKIRQKVRALKDDHESKVVAIRGQLQDEFREAIKTRLVPKIDQYANKLFAALAARKNSLAKTTEEVGPAPFPGAVFDKHPQEPQP